jgi:hypothetical protein
MAQVQPQAEPPTNRSDVLASERYAFSHDPARRHEYFVERSLESLGSTFDAPYQILREAAEVKAALLERSYGGAEISIADIEESSRTVLSILRGPDGLPPQAE